MTTTPTKGSAKYQYKVNGRTRGPPVINQKLLDKFKQLRKGREEKQRELEKRRARATNPPGRNSRYLQYQQPTKTKRSKTEPKGLEKITQHFSKEEQKLYRDTMDSILDKDKNIKRLKVTITTGAYIFWLVIILIVGFLQSGASTTQQMLSIPLVFASFSVVNVLVLSLWLGRYGFSILFIIGLIAFGLLI